MDLSLERLDGRPVPDGRGECRVFMVCCNEAERLPYTLDYHRTLGVARFLVMDNGSDDGSLEFLLQQPDCHVFRTDNSFAGSRYGVAWVNALLDMHGREGWNLVLDADELFVFPQRRLDRLTALVCSPGSRRQPGHACLPAGRV